MRISDWSSDVCSSDLPKGAFDFEEFSSYFPITVICTLIGAPADTIPSLRSSLEAVGLSASMQREHVPALQAGFIEIDGFVHKLIADRRCGKRLRPERDLLDELLQAIDGGGLRSEERRVGKECVSKCRSRWSPDH